MNHKIRANNISEGYLEILEQAKKQYQEYVEVSKLYELTALKKEKNRSISRQVTNIL